MIALRRRLDHAAHHPVIGPVVLLLLALLLALTIMHGTHDQLVEDGLLCVGIAFVLISLTRFVVLARALVLLVGVSSDRAPPPRGTRLLRGTRAAPHIPLRL